jgi:transposase-like protein
MPKRVRSSKYLNNGIEQDHRHVKHRIRPMLGFKRFDTATVTIRGSNLKQNSERVSSRWGSCPGDQRVFQQSGQP